MKNIKEKQRILITLDEAIEKDFDYNSKQAKDLTKVVIRGFNGERASIYTTVKYSNLESCEAKIIKSFTAINRLAKSSNFKISDEFLELKLKELFLIQGYKEMKQKEQVARCLIEIEDYIENSKNLDIDLFKAIGNVLVNGIELDELYTREYIKILKELSWLDLKVLIKISEINETQEYEDNFMNSVNRLIDTDEGNKLEEKITIDSCPKELIKMSIDNLVEKRLVYKYEKEVTIEKIVKKEKISNFNYITAQQTDAGDYSKTYKKTKKEYLSELGMKMIDLLNESYED